jgi:hypothetical protein
MAQQFSILASHAQQHAAAHAGTNLLDLLYPRALSLLPTESAPGSIYIIHTYIIHTYLTHLHHPHHHTCHLALTGILRNAT